MQDEYQLDYFKENGFVRKQCPKCGKNFWTRDTETEFCGDPPCVSYSFIGAPVFKKEYDIPSMREAYLSFFERHGHTRVNRYPVIARWRDDIYLTIASIADFQPFVTSGLVPPPANPLTISQPCIRLDDLDAVGRSGRHLTTFEMMAHHCFNSRGNEIYWKDGTVELCDSLLVSLGLDLNAITYKESPWAGGGNAGPSVEVMVGGLELATLVFMDLKQTKGGSIDIKGETYEKMDNYIVDTGYGLERFVWASRGSPTIYDAVFPKIVNELMDLAGIEHAIENPEYAEIFSQNARLAGVMDISGQANLLQLRKKVADSIGTTVEKLQKIMAPVETVYAITDHSRCLAFMFGDGIIPSNVKGGYLARLVLRRTLRLMKELGIKTPLFDIIEMQIRNFPEYPEFRERLDTIHEIVDLEEEKYAGTIERGTKLMRKTAQHFKEKKQTMPLGELIQLYDTHGIPPEITREVAKEIGVDVELPDTFYSLVAKKHSKAEVEETEDLKIEFPPTRKLYYEHPEQYEFEAKVLEVIENNIILDQTLFYPEGGGQPADHGTLAINDYLVNVVDARSINGIILHETDSDFGFKKGDIVKGKIDVERRMAHTRHHTATHIVNEAAKTVLGKHIWQTGAQKSTDRARLDLTHFKRITDEEFKEIELLANRAVMKNQPVHIDWMDRVEAEKKYGFVLYQGGVPPGKEIRILRVGNDVEACGGTHVQNTGLIGPIKLIKTERIQDGVERIEYSAGEAAVKRIQERDDLLNKASDALRVSPEQLPDTVNRFFEEWKDFKKENERLKAELAEVRVKAMMGDTIEIYGLKVLSKMIPNADVEELIKAATEFGKNDGVVAILASDSGGVKIVVAAGARAQKMGVNSGAIVREMAKLVGGGGGGKPGIAQGGGKDVTKIGEALERGVEMVREKVEVAKNKKYNNSNR
ncbi:MAG: alanine--tRNA ligase [Candidatus Methanoperedens sp.]|nr:alanine--tRNA ligase [Candidatus Methanoperedens sp.]MCE8427489.1 alanine--tRNA ligase [Candidatus Methanoperedens sp.]